MITKKNKDEIEQYLKDASNFTGNADCVYIPENENDLIDIVKELYKKNIPYTISGARTGLTGASIPLEGAIISMEKFERLLDLDTLRKTALVQANYTIAQLENEIQTLNLFYPPNPTEKNSSLGGNVSTNASGSRTFKYGPTRNWISALKIVLPQGDTLSITRGTHFAIDEILEFSSDRQNYQLFLPYVKLLKVKNSAGIFCYKNMDLIDLFIGCEGTLGIVTEIELKLIDLPEKVLGLLIFFDDEIKMLDFVDDVRNKSRISFKELESQKENISARLIEFFDKNSLALLNKKYPDIPEYSKSAVWIEQEYICETEDCILNKWYSLIKKYTSLSDYSWIAMSESEHQKIREFRHELPLQVNEILSRYQIRKIGSDIAVPDDKMHYFYLFLKNELENLKIPYMNWGHIGNSHFHANVLPNNVSQYEQGLLFLDKCLKKAIGMGGSISGEHGIGKIKKKYLKMMFGEKAIEGMKNIKKSLDPKMLLNRGNLFD